PSRDVDAVAHHCVAEAFSRTHVADQHVSRMEADPDAKRRLSLRAPFCVDPLHSPHSPQGANTASQHVIRQWKRCAPAGLSAVTDELVDGPFLFRNRFADLLKI